MQGVDSSRRVARNRMVVESIDCNGCLRLQNIPPYAPFLDKLILILKEKQVENLCLH